MTYKDDGGMHPSRTKLTSGILRRSLPAILGDRLFHQRFPPPTPLKSCSCSNLFLSGKDDTEWLIDSLHCGSPGIRSRNFAARLELEHEHDDEHEHDEDEGRLVDALKPNKAHKRDTQTPTPRNPS
jgi:hypothetical protein